MQINVDIVPLSSTKIIKELVGKFEVSVIEYSDAITLSIDHNNCILCPQLIKINNVVQYSEKYVILEYHEHNSIEFSLITSRGTENRGYYVNDFFLIYDTILRNFDVHSNIIAEIYKSKYIEHCADKIILLRLVTVDMQLLMSLIRLIAKKLTKVIGHLPIKFKKIS